MQCQYCNKKLSSKSALNFHQKKTRYCLKLQGKENIKGDFICDICETDFQTKSNLNNHYNICQKKIHNVKKLIERIKNLEKENNMLRQDKKDLQERYDNLSIKAIERPTTTYTNNTKNIQVNNFLKNAPSLTEQVIKDNVENLTLEHHVKGEEGYAEYALEFPFKDKIVCVDVNRNKIKYKDGEGNVIEDVGFQKMMKKLCEAVKNRSYELTQDHYEKLALDFTEKELDSYNFNKSALAIARYANGKENDFCSRVIKLISKGSVVNK